MRKETPNCNWRDCDLKPKSCSLRAALSQWAGLAAACCLYVATYHVRDSTGVSQNPYGLNHFWRVRKIAKSDY